MFKYLLFIGTTATVGFMAWRTFNEVSSPPPPTSAPVVTQKIINDQTQEIIVAPSIEPTIPPAKESTLKSAELHAAFAKILDKEKPNRKPAKRRYTTDELIALHLKTGSTAMTGAERKLVIKKIKLDIKNLEKQYADVDGSVDENKIEIKIGHRREQLETFENIESQFPGANFEN